MGIKINENRNAVKEQIYFYFSNILEPSCTNSECKIFYTIYTCYIYLYVKCTLKPVLFHCSCACPSNGQTCCDSVPWYSITTCSSAPVCDWSAPLAVRAPKLGPHSTAGCSLGFHLSWRSSRWTLNRAFVAGLECPGPFFLLPCSSLFFYIPLHSSLNLPASLPDPPCSQRRSSYQEEDSHKHSWGRPRLRLHTVKPASEGQPQRLGRGFPDVGFGTSKI